MAIALETRQLLPMQISTGDGCVAQEHRRSPRALWPTPITETLRYHQRDSTRQRLRLSLARLRSTASARHPPRLERLPYHESTSITWTLPPPVRHWISNMACCHSTASSWSCRRAEVD